MRYHRITGLFLLLALLLGIAPEAQAQVGNCTPALGEAFLDINNVRARILNNGGLFWRGDPFVYEVPKGGGANAIFTSGIWIGGFVGGNLRAAAARYGSYQFWGGPLDDNGNPPADCAEFDRLYKVSRSDMADALAGQRRADVEVPAVPFDVPSAAHFAGLPLVGVGLFFGEPVGVERGRGRVVQCRCLLVERFVRAFVVELLTESIESVLLGALVALGRCGGFGLEGSMHAFVSAVLLGFAGRNAIGSHAQTNPPHRQLREAC